MRLASFLADAAALFAAHDATAQTKWDMPTPYAPGNFHTVNVEKFADGVKQATGGKLVIAVHSNASLFKMPEIKRAVQTGQAQIGEVLMVVLSNENPLYDIDGLPFFATSYDAARVADLQRPLSKNSRRPGLKLLYAVPYARPSGQQGNQSSPTWPD